jgi:presenilin-like A22 family membrane protease
MFQEKKSMQELFAVLLMGLFFVIIHGLALLILQPFESAGIQPAFDDPNNPTNIIYIFAVMLVFTVIILLIAKYWKKQVIQCIILAAVGYTAFYAFFLPVFTLVIASVPEIILLISILSAIILVLLLYKYPEWYVIDGCGVIIGTSAIIVFGISLSVLLVLVLLIVLALYDAISVYKTKHMIDLADTVMDLKLPVLLVVPKIRHYSLIKETKRLKESLQEGEEREAFFMGLGDVVMPGILVIAIYSSVPNGLPIALGTMIGTLVGFVLLMRFVLKGKPQAGLPLLCGGAILGYICSSLLYLGYLPGLEMIF